MRKIGKIRKFIKRILEKYGSLDEKKWKNMEVWISKCKQINATFIITLVTYHNKYFSYLSFIKTPIVLSIK